MDPDEANAPHLCRHLKRGERGREVWYSLVTDTDGGLALWYRYTLLSTEGGHSEARLWAGLTGTDRDFFETRRYPLEEAAFGTPFSLSFGEAYLSSSSAQGALGTDAGDVSWRFEYEPDDTVFTPLRSERLTDVAEHLGSGRHWSANQSVRMDGRLDVGDETYDFEDAPGHQGHTAGRSAPDGWSWLQCNGFDDCDACIEALNVEERTSLCFRRDGETHALNRLKDVAGPTANETTENRPGMWKVRANGEGVKLHARVEAGKDWKKAAYLTPDDTPRYVAHSSLASVRVTYRVRKGWGWSERRTLESDSARVEWASVSPPVGEREEYTPQGFR